MLLKDRVAIITGISGGIGHEMANIFAREGATVVGIDMKEPEEANPVFDFVKLNITDYEACGKAVDAILKKYGHIDVLVNNAGITRDALTEKMSEEMFDAVINVNLKGVWNMGRFVGPIMREQNYGSIINISSISGVFGNIGQSNYAATKAGVIGITKTWAKEFARHGRNVRVNAIAPGYTMTNMLSTVPDDLLEQFAQQTMLGRLAQPEEIGKAALFLASELASYVTGHTLRVDGGMRL